MKKNTYLGGLTDDEIDSLFKREKKERRIKGSVLPTIARIKGLKEEADIGTIQKAQDGNYYKRIESPGSSGVWKYATKKDLKAMNQKKKGDRLM